MDAKNGSLQYGKGFAEEMMRYTYATAHSVGEEVMVGGGKVRAGRGNRISQRKTNTV